MDIAHSVPTHVKSISFSFLTSQDIHRISVKQITNPELLDSLNQPNVGGLYDPALGPSSKHDICGTCRLTYFTCPGHFGHIELPAPVYHPLFMTNMLNILRSCCLFCHNLKMPRQLKIKYIAKLRLLEHGLLEAALGLDDVQPAIAFKENSGDIEDDIEESMEDFEKRVNLYVAVCLRKANGTKRDDYKDGLVYQLRKDLILDFVKTASTFKKCGSCSAHGYTFRKEGHTKIIEYDLVPGFKAAHKMANIVRPNVLKGAAPSYPSGTDRDNTDVNMASDSEVGSSEGEDAAEMEHRLPKAANGTVKTSHRRSERVIAPEEARAHLRRLFSNEKILCSLIYGRHGPHAPLSVDGLSFASADMFFMDVLAVPPTRFRPPAKLGEQLFEHPQNELLGNVLKASYRLRDLNSKLRDASMKDTMEQEGQLPGDRDRILAQLLGALVQLQVDVNSFIDSSKNPTIVRQGKLPPQGVKQGLEKKEGLFRKNMMGKRVNYAARSVISPDVNIETNEIGIPPIFARKLTFPEPVTFHNVHEMRQLVINGPKYPGASIVQFEDGSQQSLDKLTVEQRVAIANQLLTPMEGSRAVSSSNLLSTRTTSINKKVFRHLRDGDILLLNRQPTLHKPSMMAHKARVLKGEKTIRMHYANCNSYNGR
ncbi:hypothetical protein FRC03_000139 [Tulasnella sp. 419]|nr:hypothetical protein FRC03_000139 [Tulasnella sp. 419]